MPKNAVKDYYKTYETLCPMIVPRSSIEVDADDEFTLMAVTTFRKYSAEFVHKVREKRWTPRDFKYEEGARKKEGEEVVSLTSEERRLWGETLRLGSTGYSESAMTWMHVQALRVFVETVLRYGLPADFVCGIVEVSPSALVLSSARAPSYRYRHADETVLFPAIDNPQIGEESKGLVDGNVRVSRRQCHEQGQEGPPSEGRFGDAARDAGCRAIVDGWRVHAICVL